MQTAGKSCRRPVMWGFVKKPYLFLLATTLPMFASGGAIAVDVGDAWWLDVDDARALAQAEAAMKAHSALTGATLHA